jgi:hypothetical protein
VTQTTIRTRAGIAARISGRVRRRQRELSARIFAAADDRARRRGWTVTVTTGRFGFEARSYRDARFDDRRRRLAPGADALGTRSDPARAANAGERHGCT